MVILGDFKLYLLNASATRHGPVHAKITSREGLVAEFAAAASGFAGIFCRSELRRSMGKV
jgi:hypothetical protein